MIHFYKPNQWNTGCCCSFSYNTGDKSFYVQLLKQLSWDTEKSKGKFDTSSRSTCKYTASEIGSFIDCIETGREFSSFHKTVKENTSFSFKAKIKDDKKDGFIFTLTKMPVKGEKKSYSIGFTFGESKFLKQFLLTALGMHSVALIKENNEAIAKSLAAKQNEREF